MASTKLLVMPGKMAVNITATNLVSGFAIVEEVKMKQLYEYQNAQH